MEYYLTIKKNGAPIHMTWMNPGDRMPNERNQHKDPQCRTPHIQQVQKGNPQTVSGIPSYYLGLEKELIAKGNWASF